MHWDQIAAQYIGQNGPRSAPDDFKGVPFSPFKDKNGVACPWQCCESAYSPPGNGAMSSSTLSVPIDPNATCSGTIGQDFTKDDCKAIRDYYDFIRYTQSTQGHLNSQGPLLHRPAVPRARGRVLSGGRSGARVERARGAPVSAAGVLPSGRRPPFRAVSSRQPPHAAQWPRSWTSVTRRAASPWSETALAGRQLTPPQSTQTKCKCSAC